MIKGYLGKPEDVFNPHRVRATYIMHESLTIRRINLHNDKANILWCSFYFLNDGESKISIIFENKYNITVKSVQSLEGDCI